MRARHLLAGALAAGPSLLTAAPATAAPDEATSAPSVPADAHWQPYHTQPFTAPAGLLCTFPLAGEPVVDEERIATLATFADGSPQRQVIMGDLRMRFTNLDSGAAVERDLDGIGFIEYGADGSYLFEIIGPAAVGFRPTDPYPAGMWAFDGYHVVYTAPQRAYREVRVDHGTEHNICTDLD